MVLADHQLVSAMNYGERFWKLLQIYTRGQLGLVPIERVNEKKRVQGYSAKMKQYLGRENEVNKSKASIYYEILRCLYIHIYKQNNKMKEITFPQCQLTDQLLFKT